MVKNINIFNDKVDWNLKSCCSCVQLRFFCSNLSSPEFFSFTKKFLSKSTKKILSSLPPPPSSPYLLFSRNFLFVAYRRGVLYSITGLDIRTGDSFLAGTRFSFQLRVYRSSLSPRGNLLSLWSTWTILAVQGRRTIMVVKSDSSSTFPWYSE